MGADFATEIRVATAADYIAMDAVFRASVRALCYGSYDALVIEHWAGIARPERYVQGKKLGCEYYVMLKEGKIICYGALHIKNQLLEALFVAPDYKSKGIGRKMLMHLILVARSAGLNRLRLDSSLNAVEFYRRNGFVEKARGKYLSSSGVLLDSVVMECLLDLGA